jgi:6-phosphofructokinase 2
MSIVTVTFSPCIDRSGTTAQLIPEKKLVCEGIKLEPGGGGINVSRALARIGKESMAVYPAGGCNGALLNQLLSQEQIHGVSVPTMEETRENIIIFEEKNQQQFRFGMPGSKLYPGEFQECLNKIQKISHIEILVASGSLPVGVPTTIYAEMTKLCRAKNARLVLDTSGEALRQGITAGAYLIKPNLGELAFLCGKDQLSAKEIIPAARELLNQYPIELIVVSMGKAGAILITQDEAIQAKAPTMPIKSTVGAGDSMVAGMVYCLAQKKDLTQVISYGVAAGTAATLNPGTELCKLEDIQALLPKIKTKKLDS